MATKKNYLPYYLLGGAALIAGYFYRDEIKKLFVKEEPEAEEPEAVPTVETKVITTNGVQTVKAPVTKKLSPLNTPKNKLNFDTYLSKGDKGQEVLKLQQILNRISKITGKPKITEDGDFGPGTETRLASTFGNISKINLFKMYAALFAVYAANKNKKLKNWFSDFYKPYLTDQTRYTNARTLYFQNNPEI